VQREEAFGLLDLGGHGANVSAALHGQPGAGPARPGLGRPDLLGVHPSTAVGPGLLWQDRVMAEQHVSSGTGADVASLVVAVLGGTGDQGRGLARRLAAAGNPVIIGSRSAQRAAATAAGLGGGPRIQGMANEDAARAADVVIVAVPWEGHRELLASLAEPLAGKIVIDCVNPVGFDDRGCYPLTVAEGSAAEQAAAVLPGSVVVGAFHHVSAVLLLDPEVAAIDLDVLVLGDDRSATDLVAALAARIPGVRGVYAGRLRNCWQVEALTANLVSINRRYKAHAGLRITDI
jgi:NADPH-dependent F420 reductase